MCKTAKEVWHTLIITYQGISQVKICKTDILTQEYVKLSIYNEETIDSGFTRFTAIRAKVTTIKEAKDLATLHVNKLIGNRKVYEMVLDNDNVASKTTKEKFKSLALKAKVTREETSDDSDSQDRSDKDGNQFGKGRENRLRNKGGEISKPKGACYNCGIEGHFAISFTKEDCTINKNGKTLAKGHRRNGHANMRLVQNLASNELVRNLPKLSFERHFCNICGLGSQGYSQTSLAYIMLNNETMRVEESLNLTFDESFPKPKLSPLVEDDWINEPIVQDPKSIKEARGYPIEQVIGELNERTLSSPKSMLDDKVLKDSSSDSDFDADLYNKEDNVNDMVIPQTLSEEVKIRIYNIGIPPSLISEIGEDRTWDKIGNPLSPNDTGHGYSICCENTMNMINSIKDLREENKDMISSINEEHLEGNALNPWILALEQGGETIYREHVQWERRKTKTMKLMIKKSKQLWKQRAIAYIGVNKLCKTHKDNTTKSWMLMVNLACDYV
nr:hypothetical protein [Tanacetum cinerariifolium]